MNRRHYFIYLAFLLTPLLACTQDYPVYHAGFDILPGRVIVEANGKGIEEYKDWMADYTNDIITIINESLISSQAHISIYESEEEGIFNLTDTLEYFHLGSNYTHWQLSGIPLHHNGLFPEAAEYNSILSGVNRALLSWYIIDPVFYDMSGPDHPSNITVDDISKPETMQVFQSDIFPSKDIPHAPPEPLNTFDIAFFPTEKGPGNYETAPTVYSHGTAANGSLLEPAARWGGMVQNLDYTNWEILGIKYIDILLIDPYKASIANDTTDHGQQLLVQIGRFSEDIHKDHHQLFENGINEYHNGINTAYGKIPGMVPSGLEFIDPVYQDAGLDGLPDEIERVYFEEYLNNMALLHGEESEGFKKAFQDPSSDNYHYFLSDAYNTVNEYKSIINRYKLFNLSEGNTCDKMPEPEPYPTAYSPYPNTEDLNRNLVFDTAECYYQFNIPLCKRCLSDNNPYIDSVFRISSKPLPNQQNLTDCMVYRIKIAVGFPDTIIGPVSDLRNVEMIRLVLTGFGETVVLRTIWFVASRVEEPFPFAMELNNNEVIELYEKISPTKLWPNPNNGICCLHLGINDAKEISIFDTQGKQVYIKKFENSSDPDLILQSFEKRFYLPGLKCGMYLVKVDKHNNTDEILKMVVY